MGMNAEFTGRQNVYNIAGLMGFTRDRIERLMPEIEDFAEIGDYFDQPLRIYSSGMQMRVAFSVATAVKPES
jgi:lipopolysaccharide transport system ATP-binding protein